MSADRLKLIHPDGLHHERAVAFGGAISRWSE